MTDQIIDESNVTVINSEHEAKSARILAGRMFMARLAPTGFTVKPEYQMKWWGHIVYEP